MFSFFPCISPLKVVFFCSELLSSSMSGGFMRVVLCSSFAHIGWARVHFSDKASRALITYCGMWTLTSSWVPLNEEEMCQIKIVSANSAEFGQNLDLKCQLFFLLSLTSRESARESQTPHLLVRLESQEQIRFLPRALETAEGSSEEMVSIRVEGNHKIAAEWDPSPACE